MKTFLLAVLYVAVLWAMFGAVLWMVRHAGGQYGGTP